MDRRQRPRLRRQTDAAFLICPAQAELITGASLRGITAPVDVWWVGDDDQASAETNALRYASLIPDATEHCAHPSADHYVFVKDLHGANPIRTDLALAAVDFFQERLSICR